MLDKTAQFPIGQGVRMADMYHDPYPTFKEMLGHEPVSWIPEIGMWYITRRSDVLDILADTERFTVVSDQSLMRQAMGYNMLTTDGAEQSRLRRPFNSSFAPRGIRNQAEPFIATLANQLIDQFESLSTIDIKAEFADIIAIQTIVDILGLEVEDYAQIRRWVSDFGNIMSNFAGDLAIIAQGRQSFREFSDYVMDRLDHLRQHPDETVLSRLLQTPDHQLSDEEIVDSARVIIFGGVETTSALITNTLWCLLNHPDQLRAVQANPQQVMSAIEEALRFESPVQTCTRHVLEDVEIRGVRILAGDTLQCMLGAANRDPAHYENPHQFDMNRENARDHLAFANGKHFCIGAGLARIEADVSIRVLLERIPNLSLLYPDEDRPLGYEFRSPHQLRLAIG